MKEILDGVEQGGGGASGVTSVNGSTGVVVLDQDDIADGTTNKQYSQTEKTKLSDIEDSADINNISDANATELTDGSETTLHTHASTPGVAPYGHFTISTAQNMGGANGTVHYVDWDGTEINKDTGFTHSTVTNSSRIQVDADGRYEIKANVSVLQGGTARTTYMSGLRVNGSTANVRGRQRNYSRGSGYGDTSTGLNTEIDLTDGDYIEMSMTIDDADSSYTSNTINAECEFIIRKIA